MNDRLGAIEEMGIKDDKKAEEDKDQIERRGVGGELEGCQVETSPPSCSKDGAGMELWQEVVALRNDEMQAKHHQFRPSQAHTAVVPDGDSKDSSAKKTATFPENIKELDVESNPPVSSVTSAPSHSQAIIGTQKEKCRGSTNFVRHALPPAAESAGDLTDLEGLPSAPHSGPQVLSLSRQSNNQLDPLSLKGAWRVGQNTAYRLNRRGGDDEYEFNERRVSAGGDVRADSSSSSSVDNGRREEAEEAIVLWTEGDLVEDPDLVEGKVDRPRRRIFAGLGMIMVLILVISVSVGVTVSKRASAPQASAGPTQSPTLAPTFQAVKITPAMVEEWLNNSKLSNATISAINQTGTPQYRAFQWLASPDHPAIPDAGDPLPRMTQQFALATLYYATSGDNASGWSNRNEWLVAPNECEWLGCSCQRTNGSLVLQSLSLNNNSLTGTIASEIFQLTGLSSLSLDNNKLNGTIATEIGHLTKLTNLEIWNNEDLTGTLPTELGYLTGLTRLWMLSSKFSGPRLSGPIPTELGNLTSLTNLIMSGYQFSGTIPSELASLSLLDWLNLARNELTGTVASELGQLSKLGQLDVSSNTGLMGYIPSEVCSLMNQNTLTVTISCDDEDLNCTCRCTCA